MSEYEPGTVGEVTATFNKSAGPLRAVFNGTTWIGPWVHLGGEMVASVRVLHVLANNEVAVNVGDLRWIGQVLSEGGFADGDAHDTVRRALDAYDAARTPQIEEPQGLGAVVEDASKVRWVRADQSNFGWFCTYGASWKSWPAIKATRVLSEGVRLDEEAGR